MNHFGAIGDRADLIRFWGNSKTT